MRPKRKATTSTRTKYQQQARKLRATVLRTKSEIPPIFGTVTYLLSAVAAVGTPVRLRDVSASLGQGAERTLRAAEGGAGLVRTFLKTQQGHGPRPVAVMFDETFPLAKEIVSLARKIGTQHPLPLTKGWPGEQPPSPKKRKHEIDVLFGSEVNTLVLATVRVLRGKVGRVELEAAVPYDSLVAVERAARRLRDFGILDERGTYLADTPWRPHLERLLDGYLRLRPDFRQHVRERAKAKRDHRAARSTEPLFGLASTARVLAALALYGPMTRTRLRAITMLTHQNTALDPLVAADVLAVETRTGSPGKGTRAHGTRQQLVVGLNAAFPVYKELRDILVALSDDVPAENGRIARAPAVAASDRPYDVTALFSTAPLLWALLMINSVPDRELDVASLHRLRPQHAEFTLHGRMRWLMTQGLVKQRRQGLVIYYGLNPDHRLYRPLKRLLDRISKIWPDLVEAAKVNNNLKPARRIVLDRNARKRTGEPA